MSTEQPADQSTKQRRPRKNTDTDPLAGMSEKQRQIFRFGAFDEKRYKYLGLKPGVTADDINPNWRSEALRLLFAASAVDSSINARKGERIRRVAETLASMTISGAFGQPVVQLNNETGNVEIDAGEFWYLGVAERQELLKLFEATKNHPDFPHLPDVHEGIDEGLDLIDDIVLAMGNIQEQSKIDHLRQVIIQAIVEHERFVNYPSFQEAVKVLITSKRFSRKRTLTSDLTTQACTLYSERHDRLRAAAKDYTVHKRRHPTEWSRHVARDDKDRPGKPKIPAEILKQLPFKAERELALEWTAEEMNRRHSNLGATANTIRTLLRRAILAIKKEPNIH